MKNALTFLLLISFSSLSFAQAEVSTSTTMIKLRLKSAEVKQQDILDRIMAIADSFGSDPQMKEVLENMAGTFVSVAAVTVVTSYFAQTVHGAITNTMGVEETHLQRVGIKSLKYAGVLGIIASGIHYVYLTHSKSFIEEKEKLKKQDRQQSVEEYKKLLLSLNIVAQEIDTLKTQL